MALKYETMDLTGKLHVEDMSNKELGITEKY